MTTEVIIAKTDDREIPEYHVALFNLENKRITLVDGLADTSLDKLREFAERLLVAIDTPIRFSMQKSQMDSSNLDIDEHLVPSKKDLRDRLIRSLFSDKWPVESQNKIEEVVASLTQD